MTKICPNCKTSNPDNSGFCQNCGNKLQEKTNTGNSSVTNTGDGLSGFWNNQNTGGKAAIILSICCVGLILLVAIGGALSPDKTTTTPSNITTTPTSTTPATTTSTPAANTGGSYIEVSYTGGSWDGSVTVQSDSNDEQEFNFDGTGTKRFDLSPYGDDDVYVNAQKNDGGSGQIKAVVVKNGVTKMTKTSTEGYGIVNGWVFSYE